VIECYNLDAAALVRSGTAWERDVIGSPDPAFTISPVAVLLLSTAAALAVVHKRRTK
jgi:hypothetical protein